MVVPVAWAEIALKLRRLNTTQVMLVKIPVGGLLVWGWGRMVTAAQFLVLEIYIYIMYLVDISSYLVLVCYCLSIAVGWGRGQL